MDRCRCGEYMKAVDNIDIFLPGCKNPDFIKNYDSSGLVVLWKEHRVTDHKVFQSPCVWPAVPDADPLSNESRKVAQMWCPLMSKYDKQTVTHPAAGLTAQVPPEKRKVPVKRCL